MKVHVAMGQENQANVDLSTIYDENQRLIFMNNLSPYSQGLEDEVIDWDNFIASFANRRDKYRESKVQRTTLEAYKARRGFFKERAKLIVDIAHSKFLTNQESLIKMALYNRAIYCNGDIEALKEAACFKVLGEFMIPWDKTEEKDYAKVNSNRKLQAYVKEGKNENCIEAKALLSIIGSWCLRLKKATGSLKSNPARLALKHSWEDEDLRNIEGAQDMGLELIEYELMRRYHQGIGCTVNQGKATQRAREYLKCIYNRTLNPVYSKLKIFHLNQDFPGLELENKAILKVEKVSKGKGFYHKRSEERHPYKAGLTTLRA